MSTTIATEVAESAVSGVSLYRAIWRWHFFAGLLTIPFLLNLAITGSLYLFKDEINDTVFAYRYIVQPAGEALAPHEIADIAAAAVPGSVAKSYRDPAGLDRSAIVTVSTEAGSSRIFGRCGDSSALSR